MIVIKKKKIKKYEWEYFIFDSVNNDSLNYTFCENLKMIIH